MAEPYPFLKGHGTENDFVLLPDPDGVRHDTSGEEWVRRVRALCDRRAGLGADGVLRVVRQDGGWFMDYWNSDGSVSEMCGNGVRVFALHLLSEGLAGSPLEVGTRDGVKTVTVAGDLLTVDMGPARLLGETKVSVAGRELAAVHVDVGNPHAVVLVDDLAEAGPLVEAPGHDPVVYPTGVNVEFVVRTGPHAIALRVHERGSGETRSCGTGAVAAVAAVAALDGPGSYDVTVPGGRLTVTTGETMQLTGPAVIVARGTTTL